MPRAPGSPSQDGIKDMPGASTGAVGDDAQMEKTNGKLELTVSSKKVLARIERFDVSTTGLNGQLYSSRSTAEVFDYVLDESQVRAPKEAEDLAARSGLVLEVTDLARQGALRRMLRRLASRVERKPTRSAWIPEEPQEMREDVTIVISPVSGP
jgi:hypothetical protein